MPAVFPKVFIKGREMFHCCSEGKIKNDRVRKRIEIL